MPAVEHRTAAQLAAALEGIQRAPTTQGSVELITRRPGVGEREVLEVATLDLVQGLVGDSWIQRGSRRTPDGSAHPEHQITLMRSRVIEVLAGDRSVWPLAGDQLFVDLDLGIDNLPPGTRLAVGSAVLEVSTLPHTGCAKFSERFGAEATKWANTSSGRQLNLRGINARVVVAGEVRRGDRIAKL